MKYLNNIIVLLLLAVGLFSCKQKSLERVQLIGEAQGTYYSIIYYDDEARDFKTEIDSLLDAFDQSVSVYQPNSIISRVNRNDDLVVLDDWFIGNFQLSKRISEETNGSFDMTIGPIANIWGFGTFEKPHSIDPQKIDSLKQFVDYRKIKIENGRVLKENKGIQLNFNAVAQGYSVDVLSDFLQEKNIKSFLIDVGGEIYAYGKKPHNESWKVGIEIPEESDGERVYNKVVNIYNEAVATSGNYRKFYVLDGVKYAHSLDPKTGYPVKHSILSSTVIAETAGEADAYATAFMVMGVEKSLVFAKNHPEIKIYLMYDDKGVIKTKMSDNFKAYINH